MRSLFKSFVADWRRWSRAEQRAAFVALMLPPMGALVLLAQRVL